MNQDQVKEKLLVLEPSTEEFTLLFSGKTSRKVNGLYKPETREIIIHNRNFDNDNSLLYTAIHEFAHHIHFTTTGVSTVRAHTIAFRDIFHRLLAAAEEKKIYLNVFEAEEEFKALTRRIKEKYLSGGGELFREFGKALLEARELCEKHRTRFEDYVERVLCLSQNSAATFMKVHAMNISPEVGFENMRTLAGIRDEGKRHEAEREFLNGRSPDMVKAMLREKPAPAASGVETLLAERDRLQRTISSLQEKLEKLEEKIRVTEGVV